MHPGAFCRTAARVCAYFLFAVLLAAGNLPCAAYAKPAKPPALPEKVETPKAHFPVETPHLVEEPRSSSSGGLFSRPDASTRTEAPKAHFPVEAPRTAVPSQNGSAETTAQTPPAAPLTRAESRERDLLRRGIARISLAPVRPVVLSAPFEGTLLSLQVFDGEEVDAGQTIALFDDSDVLVELEAARVAAAAGAARLESARQGTIAELEEAAAFSAAKAAAVRRLEEQIKRAEVVAPFTGRILDIQSKPGRRLKHGEPFAEVAEAGDLEITGTVPSSWISSLNPGHLIWVYVDEAGKSYEATIARFGGKVDAETRTVRVYAHFVEMPPELLPGMSGRADFFPNTKR